MRMATTSNLVRPAVAFAPRGRLARQVLLSDFWAMTKPEINLVIAITTASAFSLASPLEPSSFPLMRLLNTLGGTLLAASGAAVLNQWMERRFDAAMRRTAQRPVAAGRVDPPVALAFGALLSIAGVLSLACTAGLLAALLATATLFGYLFLYTPAKRRTPLCTLIGAFPGAVPPLIGWAAARGRLDPEAWFLFALLFFWQLPHVMAIAWMYQDDYERAGFLVLPRGKGRVRFVTLMTLLPLLAMVLWSVATGLAGWASPVQCLGSFVLGLGLFSCGARFVLRRSGPAARRLLLASIGYLPMQFGFMILWHGAGR